MQPTQCSISLVLPSGVIEKGERPEEAARRELLEETGYAAEQWRSLGSYVGDANYGMGRAHLFVAEGARPVGQPNSGDLEEMEVMLMSVAELLAAVRKGAVASLPVVAPMALATHPVLGKAERK